MSVLYMFHVPFLIFSVHFFCPILLCLFLCEYYIILLSLIGPIFLMQDRNMVDSDDRGGGKELCGEMREL